MILSEYGRISGWAFTLLAIICSCPVHSQVQLGLDVDGETESDQSGMSVSSNNSGDRIAIGAPFNNGNGDESGHVRVFEWNGISWLQLGEDIDGEDQGDEFGRKVRMNAQGNRLAVGAPRNNSRGHVRVFEWDDSSWVQMGQDIDGQFQFDEFGRGLSINDDGDRVAIGAPFNDNAGTNAGLVQIYEWDGISWTQMGSVLLGSASNVNFGQSISLNGEGDYLAIGVPLFDGAAVNSGRVQLYSWNGSSWTSSQAISGPLFVNARFGESLDLNTSADRMIIGASGISKAYTYDLVAGTWNLQTTLSGIPGDQYGISSCINGHGDVIAIGANLDGSSGFESGRTSIYQEDNGNWNLVGDHIDGEDSFDRSGTSICLNDAGDRIVIGAPFNSEINIDAGHARIFDLSGLLPVVLSSFSTEMKNDEVTLRWTTSLEHNNAGFYIQHSLDGALWKNLAWLDGLKNSNSFQSYSYIHHNPNEGFNYYRLIQEDLDGSQVISDIKKEVIKGAEAWSIFPNPATSIIYTKIPEKSECVIYSSNGYSVPCNKLTDGTIDITGLSKGVYSIEFTTNRKSEIMRLVKQ